MLFNSFECFSEFVRNSKSQNANIEFLIQNLRDAFNIKKDSIKGVVFDLIATNSNQWVDLSLMKLKAKENKFNAKPTLENCKFCPFKIYCGDFWKISSSLKADRPLILKGSVSQIHKTQDSQYFSIELNLIESVPKYDLKSIMIHKFSSKFQIELGAEYYFMGNLDYLLEDQYRVNWNTIIVKI